MTLWVNMQPYRWTDQAVTTSALMQQLLELVEVYYREQARSAAGRRNQQPNSLRPQSGVSRRTATVSDVRRSCPKCNR